MNLAMSLRVNIKGYQILGFESFVQGKYFDQILIAANKRFYDMTPGQVFTKKKDGSRQ